MNTLITPTTRQMRYFDIARKSALQSNYIRHRNNGMNGRVSIGAAIVKGNYVVSKGFNKTKTHPFQQRHNKRHSYIAPVPRIHAEIDALIYSRYNDLSGCEVYVCRIMADGSLGQCRPCSACLGALIDAGIKHIYYTTEDGYHYERIQ